MELLCNHTFHTRCVLEICMGVGLLHVNCMSCQIPMIPADMIDEGGGDTDDYDNDTREKAIGDLFNSQPTFVAELKRFKSLWTKTKVDRAALKRTITALHGPFKTEMKPVADFLKDKYRAKISEIKKCPEFLAVKRSTASYGAKVRAFMRKWGVQQYDLSRFLRKNGHQTLNLASSYRSSIGYLLHRLIRKFRIRIK